MLKVKELLPVFPEETIQKRISELGEQIARDYQGEEVICVCVLKEPCSSLPILCAPLVVT